MNTVINSNENSIAEFAKRSFYSFQVLTVGIAIPFLFLFGISHTNHKKVKENEVHEVKNVTQVSAKPETVFYNASI